MAIPLKLTLVHKHFLQKIVCENKQQMLVELCEGFLPIKNGKSVIINVQSIDKQQFCPLPSPPSHQEHIWQVAC